jgi:hypothetical protein
VIKQLVKQNDLVILLLVCISLIIIWFSKGMIFAGGEEEIPFYDLEKTFSIYYHTWRDSDLGFPNIEQVTRIPYFYILKILANIGISNILLQAATFFLLLVIGGVSIYYFLKSTLQSISSERIFSFVPLVGALFYILNPYSMSQVWGRGLYIQYFPFALFPLFLLCLHLSVIKKNNIYLVIGLLSTYILSGAFGNISYVLSFFLMISLYLLMHLHRNRNKEDLFLVVKTFLFIIIGFYALHSWWILHDKAALSVSLDNRSASPEQNLGTLRGVSWAVPAGDSIRLLHNYITKDYNYTKIYDSVVFFLISLIPPVTLWFAFKKIKKTSMFYFFSSFFVLTYFFVLGSNLPTGYLFEFLFTHIYPLQVYRNPYEKIGILYTLSYTPFFAVGLVSLSKFIQQKISRLNVGTILTGLMLLYCGIFVWPMWTGQFAGGVNFNAWIEVPSYYRDSNNWFNRQKGEFRLLHVPLIPGDGMKYTWEHSYQGTDPSEHIFTKSSISRHISFNSPYYSHLLTKFETPLYETPKELKDTDYSRLSLTDQLSALGIKYIVLHHDVDTKISGAQTIERTEEILKKEFLLVKTFGELSIFEVPNTRPLVHSSNDEVLYQKKSPVHYTTSGTEDGALTKVILLENYSPFWEARGSKEVISTHQKELSFLNSWTTNENNSLTISYTLQKYVDSGLELSFITCILFLSYIPFALKNTLLIKEPKNK